MDAEATEYYCSYLQGSDIEVGIGKICLILKTVLFMLAVLVSEPVSALSKRKLNLKGQTEEGSMWNPCLTQ